jgi:hypothetical protein
MAEKTRGKKKKKSTTRPRYERRYLPEPDYASRASTGIGMAGSLALGAGVWAQWIKEPPPPSYAMLLVAAGAAGLFASLWLSSRGASAIHVGDAGVALEEGKDLKRIAWFEIENLGIKNGTLLLKTASGEIALPIEAHPKAAARIVQEAAQRIGARVDISPAQHAELPRIGQDDAEQLEVDSVQVTGKHCAASDEVITFERDARLCPSCGAIYHREHVPTDCKICGATIRDRALAV